MKKNTLQDADQHAKYRRRRNLWYNIVICLAVVVVFCTTYALILPAITLETDQGSIPEQTHNETLCTQENGLLLPPPSCMIEGAEDTALLPAQEGGEEPQGKDASTADNGAAADLREYVQNNGGSFFFTLSDSENREVPKDDAGNYIVTAETPYILTMGLSLPEGIAPGSYQYQLPEGLTVAAGSGTFTLNGTDVGTWTVSESGLLTFDFNQNINNRTDVTISSMMSVVFHESEQPINFDGNITVTVQKPPEEETNTEVNKWARVPSSIEGAEPDKIYWELEIIGGTNSQIIGSTLTDRINTDGGVTHQYTQSDMEAGIKIEAFEYDENGECITEHCWTIYPGDPNLNWTENGWSYVMPTAIPRCEWCEETNYSVGNDNWIYYILYTSTACDEKEYGTVIYRNTVTIDGASDEGWAQRQKGDSSAGIVKTGVFQADQTGGKYIWTVNVTIPGCRDGAKTDYHWYLWDDLRIRDENGNTVAYLTNDMDKASVTATYTDETGNPVVIEDVPSSDRATEEDQFYWINSWSDEENGISYGREIDFYCRCACTKENCHFWTKGTCSDEESGFCRCWTFAQDVTFTFTYETDALDLIENYGGVGNLLRNSVQLNNKQLDSNNVWQNINIDSSSVKLPIPGLFRKELTQDYNGYIAKYTITLNEARLQLTDDGQPLTIRDEMTQTLAYLSGTLVITAQDAEGNSSRLLQDVDYTVTYDGTGTQTDASGQPVHVLEMILLNPQPVQYTLEYDATLIIPAGTSGGVKYANSANVTLFGKKIVSGGDEKIYTDINISAKNYHMELEKTAGDTGAALEGAVFGLYTENGGLICRGETDAAGKLSIETDVTHGIILRAHTLYYIMELEAPQGYFLDTGKHWFYFCDEASVCTECEALLALCPSAARMPGDTVGTLQLVNYPAGYELPATGGPGIAVFTLLGGLMMTGGVCLLCVTGRRKKCG